MVLGISSALDHDTPMEWARKHRELGCGAVVFPVDSTAPAEVVEAYQMAAKKENLMIAEVGVWRNTLDADPKKRESNIAYAVKQLRLADQIGANCCVNIVGTPHGPIWDGAYAGNYSNETWKMAVQMIRRIIDEAAPEHTKFTIEPMPWMIPSGPNEYLRLIEAVNRDAFGVHMDLVNMINCPTRYFDADAFMEECFNKLRGLILSCHLKDSLLLQRYTFQLQECACGEGALHLEKYAELASRERYKMPMIIEHLNSEEEYRTSFAYVQKRLQQYME